MVVGIVNKEEKEKWIFNIHKEDIIEDTINYKSKLRKKYKLSLEEVHDIFARIINYQIDKYGLQKQRFILFIDKREYIAKSRRHAQRRHARTKE